MAGTKLVNADLEVQGSIKLTTTPNNTGSILTKHTDGTISVRTPAQIKSDIGANFTAGSGLTLSGTTFSLPVTISGTGSFVQSVAQNTNGITVTLGTPPNTTYSTGSLAELNAGTVTTGRLWGSNVLNSWLNGKLPAPQTLSLVDEADISISDGNTIALHSLRSRGIGWDVAFNGKSYFNTSSQGNPLGGSSVAHGIVIAHGGNTTYGTSLAFRNNRAWFQSLENGSLNPWLEIATREWANSQGWLKSADLSGQYLKLGANTDAIGVSNGIDLGSMSSHGVYATIVSSSGLQNNPLDSLPGAIYSLRYASGNQNIGSQMLFDRLGDQFMFRSFSSSEDSTGGVWRNIWHDGNLTQTSINNWNTAFGWGDHNNKYVGAGSYNSSSLPAYTGDLNSIQQSRAYASFISTTVDNAPFGQVGGFLNLGLSSGITSQLLLSRDGNNLAFRGDINGSNMSPWRIVYHSGNLRSNTQNDARYLRLTGGTVTGVIKSPAPVADADLANKQYVDSQSVLEPLDEGNGVGYAIKGRNPNNYGNIGLGAVDFSHSPNASSLVGATADYSVAFGHTTTASGIYSVAFGASTKSSGAYSFATGLNANASGLASVAIGNSAKASGSYSISFGNSTASGAASTAFGGGTTASGTSSTAFGGTTTASGYFSAAFGAGTIANEYGSVAIGRYCLGGSAETDWVNGSPVFKVGNGSVSSRRNAYVLYNDGKSTQYGVASYGADYSANFTDRSLVDKEYVDSSIPEVIKETFVIGDVGGSSYVAETIPYPAGYYLLPQGANISAGTNPGIIVSNSDLAYAVNEDSVHFQYAAGHGAYIGRNLNIYFLKVRK